MGEPDSLPATIAELRERAALANARLAAYNRLLVETVARAEYLKLMRTLYAKEG
jgi:hypothetical protein